MLNILYCPSRYQYRHRGEDDIFAGQVATFTGNRETKICRENDIPIGFFVDDYLKSDFWLTSPRISVLVGQAEFVTDIYEPSEYKINDFLYCSKNGRVTNESKYRGNIIIGVVNSFNPGELGLVTMFARNIENPISISPSDNFIDPGMIICSECEQKGLPSAKNPGLCTKCANANRGV